MSKRQAELVCGPCRQGFCPDCKGEVSRTTASGYVMSFPCDCKRHRGLDDAKSVPAKALKAEGGR